MSITYTDSLPDQEQYWRLFESTGWNAEYQLDAEQLYEAIRHSWYLVAAYDGPRLVGSGRVIADGVLHALIVDLIVAPEYQGQGIGKCILNDLVARGQAHGIRSIQLFCAKGKAGFYEKYGFVSRPADAPGMELKSRVQDAQS